MRNNRFQFNPSKTKWSRVLGHSGSGGFSSLIFKVIVLHQTDLVCSLGYLLDLRNRWLLYPAFVQFRVVCHICPFQDQESLLTVTHASVTPQMDYCRAPYWGSH